MTPPDISDAAVEAAAKVLGEIVMSNSSGTTEYEDGVTIHMTKSVEELGKEALRAAIAAAAPHLLEPVAWQHRYRLTDSDAWTDWARHNGLEYMETTKHHYTRLGMEYEARTLYRLRTQENADG